MAQERRPSVKVTDKASIGRGPYLARIVSHLDPTFMGNLEVTLLREQGNRLGDDNQTYVVRCAMPFFGYTPYEFMGSNDASKKTLDGFNDTQKSYGMWFVPPDVGVNVLVFFVDGNPSQGYWMGCVPSRFTNNMVPAIGGSTEFDADENDKKKYGTKKALPVAEVNRTLNGKKDVKIDPEKIKKPVHPIADVFLEQGLLEDDVRGTTTTSARREAPSSVFGISTPGPLDKREGSKRSVIGKVQDKTKNAIPVSRLGGTQFVMDDGDARYLRTSPANKGPVKYVNTLNGTDAATGEKINDKGEPTIPYNEYFRVRTRTGHQILMHNSEDLIYIGNAKGTTWIELTSNGKIDIFAQDSISIHTENDLNIRADRDINMEAGRNINFRTEVGRWQAEIATDMNFLINKNSKLTVGKNLDILVGSGTKISTNTDFEVSTNGDNRFSAGGDTSIGSLGDHKESAATINMNNDKIAEPAAVAAFVQPLELRKNPSVSKTAGWDKRYLSGDLNSIMKRIPMHEPWPLHENQAPDQLTPDKTDREV